MKRKVIKTAKFTLRPPKMEDAPDLAKNLNDKKIIDNLATIPYPYGIKDAKFWLNETVAFWRKKNPEKLNFLIEIEGEVVGAIGLENTEKDHKAELGYWLARKYWGGGIMSQAVEEVVNFGFKDLNLKRIYAKVYSFNEGSKKVLEKNGFTQEGYLKKEAKKGNKYIDAFLFAKIK